MSKRNVDPIPEEDRHTYGQNQFRESGFGWLLLFAPLLLSTPYLVGPFLTAYGVHEALGSYRGKENERGENRGFAILLLGAIMILIGIAQYQSAALSELRWVPIALGLILTLLFQPISLVFPAAVDIASPPSFRHLLLAGSEAYRAASPALKLRVATPPLLLVATCWPLVEQAGMNFGFWVLLALYPVPWLWLWVMQLDHAWVETRAEWDRFDDDPRLRPGALLQLFFACVATLGAVAVLTQSIATPLPVRVDDPTIQRGLNSYGTPIPESERAFRVEAADESVAISAPGNEYQVSAGGQVSRVTVSRARDNRGCEIRALGNGESLGVFLTDINGNRRDDRLFDRFERRLGIPGIVATLIFLFGLFVGIRAIRRMLAVRKLIGRKSDEADGERPRLLEGRLEWPEGTELISEGATLIANGPAYFIAGDLRVRLPEGSAIPQFGNVRGVSLTEGARVRLASESGDSRFALVGSFSKLAMGGHRDASVEFPEGGTLIAGGRDTALAYYATSTSADILLGLTPAIIAGFGLAAIAYWT